MSNLTSESFLKLVEQSGLVKRVDLDRAEAEAQEQGRTVESSLDAAQLLIDRGLLTQWQADKLLKGKHKGFSLGKYRLLELLGKGGMSSVYLAEHLLMRRRCAVKVLPIKRVKDSSYLARFHREAQAVASLDHPNIVRAYDIDQETEGDQEIHFLVMEYVEGQSLQEQVKESGVLSLEDCAEYFRQAALGLEHAHRSGLVHRDVKPGNLLIDTTEVVKVLDLGLARFSEVVEEDPLTVTHDEQILGTADYLAPEQALDSHQVDGRADIYGLGCSMCFALTGYPPFRTGTIAQRLLWHQTKEPPPISDSRSELADTTRGKALAQIVQRMMAKGPDHRYQTMSDVSDALVGWLTAHASTDWRAAHPKSTGGSESGPPLVVAEAVPAIPTAVPVAPVAAAPVVQNDAPPPTKSDASVNSTNSPQQSENAGFNDFLSQFGEGVAPQAPPASPVTPDPPFVPDDAIPVAMTAEPVASAPKTPVENIQSEPAGGGNAPFVAPVIQESVPAAPIVVEPTAETAIEPVEVTPPSQSTAEAANLETASEQIPPSNDSPVIGFDSSVIPTSDQSLDSYPSLLGGTPSGNAATGPASNEDVTQTFEPTASLTPPLESDDKGDADATVMTPGVATSSFPSMPVDAAGSAPIFDPGVYQNSDSSTPADVAPAAPIFEPEQPVSPVAPQAVSPEVIPSGSAPPEFMTPENPAAPVLPASPVAPPLQFQGQEPISSTPQDFTAPAAPVPVQPPAGQAGPVFPATGAQQFPAAPAAPVGGFAPATNATPVASQPASASAQSRTAKKKSPIGLIVGIVILLAIGAGGYFAMTGGGDGAGGGEATAGDGKGSSTTTKKSGGTGKRSSSGGPKKVQTQLTVGEGGDFKSITDALNHVKAASDQYNQLSRRTRITIEVLGSGPFKESIHIDNSNGDFSKGIQIKTGGISRPKLSPSGSGPVVKLKKLENFLLDGFEIDATGRDVAVEVSSYMNGSSLRNLTITGFKKTGVLLKGAAGVSEDVITLENLDVRPADAGAIGIQLAEGDAAVGRIHIKGCRLFGAQSAGILIDTSVLYVEIRENIIDRAGIGIHLAGGPQLWRDVVLVNNTFYESSQAGIVFTDMPINGSMELAFHRNLFAKLGGPELRIEKDFDDKAFDRFISSSGAGGVAHNWSDRSAMADITAGEREIIARELQRIDSIEFASTDPSSDDYLMLKPGTPYSRVGDRKLGGQPWIGAKGPKN